jgi:hypothetical protein
MEAYFEIEQDGQNITWAYKNRLNFSNQIVHLSWIEPFLPGALTQGSHVKGGIV